MNVNNQVLLVGTSSPTDGASRGCERVSADTATVECGYDIKRPISGTVPLRACRAALRALVATRNRSRTSIDRLVWMRGTTDDVEDAAVRNVEQAVVANRRELPPRAATAETRRKNAASHAGGGRSATAAGDDGVQLIFPRSPLWGERGPFVRMARLPARVRVFSGAARRSFATWRSESSSHRPRRSARGSDTGP